MELKDIRSQEDAQIYVEGCVNDFESGVSTKGELLGQLGGYTGRIMEIFWETTAKKAHENPARLIDELLEFHNRKN